LFNEKGPDVSLHELALTEVWASGEKPAPESRGKMK
jgi:hypothetical protein